MRGLSGGGIERIAANVIERDELDMRKLGKRIGLVACGFVCALGLFGCGKGNASVFELNGQKVSEKEVSIFGTIYANEYNLHNTQQMDEFYENGQTYSEYYKDAIKEEIMSTVLLYKEAMEHHCKLTKEQESSAKEQAKDFVSYCGEERLKKQGIKLEDVQKVYEMKAYAQNYVVSQADEESGKQPEEERYVRVYQVLFPTVVLDKNGMIQTDEQGDVKQMTSDEKQQLLEYAKELREKALNGSDLEQLAKNASGKASGTVKVYKYSDLENSYKQAVDRLSEGKVSDVITTDNGYSIIKLINQDDTDYAKNINEYDNLDKVSKKRSDVVEQLYDLHLREDKNYLDLEKWNAIQIEAFIIE